MNEQAKKLWNSPQGVSLFKSMLAGQQPSPQQQQTLHQLKQADPPKMQDKPKEEPGQQA